MGLTSRHHHRTAGSVALFVALLLVLSAFTGISPAAAEGPAEQSEGNAADAAENNPSEDNRADNADNAEDNPSDDNKADAADNAEDDPSGDNHCPGEDNGAPDGAIEGESGDVSSEDLPEDTSVSWEGTTLTFTNDGDSDVTFVWCAKGGQDFDDGQMHTGERTTTVEAGETVTIEFDQEISYFVLYDTQVDDQPQPTDTTVAKAWFDAEGTAISAPDADFQITVTFTDETTTVLDQDDLDPQATVTVPAGETVDTVVETTEPQGYSPDECPDGASTADHVVCNFQDDTSDSGGENDDGDDEQPAVGGAVVAPTASLAADCEGVSVALDNTESTQAVEFVVTINGDDRTVTVPAGDTETVTGQLTDDDSWRVAVSSANGQLASDSGEEDCPQVLSEQIEQPAPDVQSSDEQPAPDVQSSDAQPTVAVQSSGELAETGMDSAALLLLSVLLAALGAALLYSSSGVRVRP